MTTIFSVIAAAVVCSITVAEHQYISSAVTERIQFNSKASIMRGSFLNDYFVLVTCNDSDVNVDGLLKCTLYRVKKVSGKFADVQTCNFRGNIDLFEYPEPFGNDHIALYAFRIWQAKQYMVVNVNDCSNVQSYYDGKYKEKLAQIGIDIDKVFAGSMQIVAQRDEEIETFGFDSRDNLYFNADSALNPQRGRVMEEINKINHTAESGNMYLYTEEAGIRRIQTQIQHRKYSSDNPAKSNDLLSIPSCNESNCTIEQFDLQGQLLVSHVFADIDFRFDFGDIYNIKGGGFLAVKYRTWSREAYLVKVDAEGRLVVDEKLDLLQKEDQVSFTRFKFYGEDACLSWATPWRELEITTKCFDQSLFE